MKVVVSVEPVRFPLTGIGRYAFELAKGLEARSDIDALKFFSGTRFVSGVAEPSPGAGHSFRRTIQNNPLVLDLYQRLMPLWRQYQLGGHRDFLYHSPNYFLPAGFDGKAIATFHDLSAFKWAQCFEPAKVKYLRKAMTSAVDRADAIITDSRFTLREVADFFGLSTEKIHAVPLAAGQEFRPRTAEEVAPLLDRYGLGYGGYSLYVGTIEPRKNILRLLDAYRQLPRGVRERWPLVLSGYQGWRSADIHERIRAAEREGWVRYLGYLKASELPLLFSGARVFAFPSLYEGFGLPVLEAMQSGVPVICSDRSSLPEVAGDAAAVCDAEDTWGLAGLVEELLTTPTLWENRRQAGIVRAGQFSWQACINATVEVYRTLS